MSTVHILRHGLTLCGNVHGLPRDWGPGTMWIGFNDPRALEHVTCPTCRQVLEQMAPAAPPKPERPEKQDRPCSVCGRGEWCGRCGATGCPR